MEAAAARYAARDRWNDNFAPPPQSQLLRFIHAACSAENHEPNLGLGLEIADLINSKKGTAPREAAVAIVGFINSRNPNVSLLALHLLDMCVKNCGYPFHLQISTKEFLNELVRRFPERPPVRPSRVQNKILEAIEEWRSTICDTSRYKEDLGFIRDMHRLLSYKGYVFPEVRREDVAVLNPSDTLKSAEEMEEEEREAQSAKLQELIRRGAPEDLQEANRLMKIMAGYDTRSKTDYRAKAAEDVAKIQAKARLLEERLEAFQAGDKMQDGDVFSELASALRVAQPKIQKMCEEESEDHEAVSKLLEINDSIHRTVQRYELMKKGNYEDAQKIMSGSVHVDAAKLPTAMGKKSAAAELSLIDFDNEPMGNGDASSLSGAAAGAEASSQTASVENDLLGLSIGDSSGFGQGGGIALGFGANTNIPGPALLSSMTQDNSAKGTAATAPIKSPAFSAFASFTSPPASHTSTPQPSTQQSSAFAPPASTIPQSSSNLKATNDPFAALGSLGLGSAAATSSSISPAPSSQSLSSSSKAQPQPQAASKPAVSDANDDDEWSFSSALPVESTLPKVLRLPISNTTLGIECVASRSRGPNAIFLAFAFTNNTTLPISELHFQLAVTKGYESLLQPQSGRALSPNQSRGITQEALIRHAGDDSRKVDAVKLRWRVAYKLGDGGPKAELGEVPEIRIA